MQEEKRIKCILCKEFIEEFFYTRGVSDMILESPRFDIISTKLALKVVKAGFEPFSEQAKAFLSGVLSIENDSSLIINEGILDDGRIITSKYYIDQEDDTFKKLKTERTQSGKVLSAMSSTYDEYGVEQTLAIEENAGGMTRFIRAERINNYLKIIEVDQIGKNIEKKQEKYQKRVFFGALEDIYSSLDELDPYDQRHYSIFGIPDYYREIDKEEFDNMVYDDSDNEKIFSEYKKSNRDLGRTKNFEKIFAKKMCIKDIDEK